MSCAQVADATHDVAAGSVCMDSHGFATVRGGFALDSRWIREWIRADSRRIRGGFAADSHRLHYAYLRKVLVAVSFQLY